MPYSKFLVLVLGDGYGWLSCLFLEEESQESRSIQINNSLSEAVNKVINGREGAEVSSPNTVEEKADDLNGDLHE